MWDAPLFTVDATSFHSLYRIFELCLLCESVMTFLFRKTGQDPVYFTACNGDDGH